jgi:hypothetical protein
LEAYLYNQIQARRCPQTLLYHAARQWTIERAKKWTVIDISKTEVRYNGEWFSKYSFLDVLNPPCQSVMPGSDN